ncbi:MAG: hypothetical protein H7Z72_04080 [Bacteroidetes bacterium]|nr:hypothetical protein [Fibrella sp.]
MPQPRLIFRADGNAQIGLGHVMRCLALADMLGDGYDRHFVIVEPDAALTTLLTDKNITAIRLLTNNVAEFSGFVRPGDVVVLDGYSFDEAYQRTLRRGIKKLVFIDDF